MKQPREARPTLDFTMSLNSTPATRSSPSPTITILLLRRRCPLDCSTQEGPRARDPAAHGLDLRNDQSTLVKDVLTVGEVKKQLNMRLGMVCQT